MIIYMEQKLKRLKKLLVSKSSQQIYNLAIQSNFYQKNYNEYQPIIRSNKDLSEILGEQ